MANKIQAEDLVRIVGLLDQVSILAKNRSIYGEDHNRTRKDLARVAHVSSEIRSMLRKIRRRLYLICRNERFYLENLPLPRGAFEKFFLEQLQTRRVSGIEIMLDTDISELEHLSGLFSDTADDYRSRFRWLSAEKVYYLEHRPSIDDGSGGIYDSPLFSIPELRIQEEHYLMALRELSDFMERCEDTMPEELGSIGNVTQKLVDQLLESPDGLVPLTSVPYYDSFTYYHSLNVCVLSLTAARQVVTSPVILERIAQAALLHDLGKSRVPRDILYKPGRLTDAEAQVVRDHPVSGAAILQSMPKVDPLNATVAFGHHIKDGGSGYPRVSSSYRIDPVTRLVEIVDIFEALTANRPYKTPMTAKQAFEILYSAPDLVTFRPYVDLLFHAIGNNQIVGDLECDDSEFIEAVTNDEHVPSFDEELEANDEQPQLSMEEG